MLLVEESFGSAGGRAGGSGSRKIGRILGFKRHLSRTDLIIDSQETETINQFDVPYSAVAGVFSIDWSGISSSRHCRFCLDRGVYANC